MVTLTFDLLTLKLVRIIVRGMATYLPIFAVSETFRSRHMGLSDGPRDLVALTFVFGGHHTARDEALHAPTVYQV